MSITKPARKPSDPPAKRKAQGGWAASSKERMQHKALCRHLDKQEVLWRARVEATVRHYTREEIEAYTRSHGIPAARTKVTS